MADVQTKPLLLLEDVSAYMPTVPVLRPLVAKRPRLAKLRRRAFVALEVSMFAALVVCWGVVLGELLIQWGQLGRGAR